MALELYTGASGHGKTYVLYDYLTQEAKKNLNQRYVLIVPEQSSLQAQKDIVRMSENGRVFHIDVLTFGRLAYRIFEELGVELHETIDETGKNLILRKVIEQVKKDLVILKASKKQGFVNEMKSMISELKQYGITPDGLLVMAESIPFKDRLRQKLLDIHKIYHAFEDYIAGKYVTVEDKPEELLKVIRRSSFLENTVVAFDGFTGFTPVQYRLMEEILSISKDVIITAALPADTPFQVIYGEEDLFHMSKTMIARLGAICDRLQIERKVTPITTNREAYRFAKSPELDFLERKLFRYDGAKLDQPIQDIKICQLTNPREELQYTASRILELVQKKHLRFRDIAVVTGSLSEYQEDAMRILKEAGIPFFIDQKRSIIGNPLVEYLRAALEILRMNYSYEAVFRFLKSGLSPLPMEDVDQLEDYVLALGIRGGNRWKNPFVMAAPGKKKELLRINEIRVAFLAILEPLETRLKESDATAKELVLGLYEFMEQEQLYEKMEVLATALESEQEEDPGNQAKAVEFRQCYRYVIELFDRMESLLGEEVLSLSEFVEILDAGFQEIKVGLIPPSLDCITLGDIERSRLEHVKVLFLIGVNEGSIPKIHSGGGVLSESERIMMGEHQIELAPSGRERVFIQNFYLYLNMTEPEIMLYLLYHRFNGAGEEAKPSRLISMVNGLFPQLIPLMDYEIPVQDRITSKKASIHLITEDRQNENLSGVKELLAYYLMDPIYKSMIFEYLDAFLSASNLDSLSHLAAKELYQEMEKSSISRIETYAKCGFAHFARYGLELEERKVYELKPADLGSLFHLALEKVSLELARKGITFDQLEEVQRKELAQEAVTAATGEDKSLFFQDSNKNEYLRKRIIDILDKTLWVLGEQLKAGEFKPHEIEQYFEETFSQTKIVGKIDRVDMAESDGKLHVKVVDYKSGKRDLSFDEIYAGLKLQLMVYLENAVARAAVENPTKAVIAAGALYNRVDNPIVEEVPGLEEEDYDKTMLAQMCPTGFVGIESVDLMDQDFTGKSTVIPVKKDKTGLVPLGGHALTSQQLTLLGRFAIEKMSAMEQEIFQGRIEVNPYESSCEYCPYTNVCGFDKHTQRHRIRKLEKVDGTEDMWIKFGYPKEEKEDVNHGVDPGTTGRD